MHTVSLLTLQAGGGLWSPSADALARLRRDIDRKPHRIKSVLTDAGIRKEYLGGVPNDEKKAARAFVSQPENASTALKSKPKVSKCFSSSSQNSFSPVFRADGK